MKKIILFGGGSGLSQILKGLKLFPVEITAVVSVADNGASTGRLRKDLNIPAVGDISKVMLAMSNLDNDTLSLLNYRFTKSKTLGNHSVKNLLLSYKWWDLPPEKIAEIIPVLTSPDLEKLRKFLKAELKNKI